MGRQVLLLLKGKWVEEMFGRLAEEMFGRLAEEMIGRWVVGLVGRWVGEMIGRWVEGLVGMLAHYLVLLSSLGNQVGWLELGKHIQNLELVDKQGQLWWRDRQGLL